MMDTQSVVSSLLSFFSGVHTHTLATSAALPHIAMPHCSQATLNHIHSLTVITSLFCGNFNVLICLSKETMPCRNTV